MATVIRCGLGGATAAGEPCDQFIDGQCTNPDCAFSVNEEQVRSASEAEHVQIPDRIQQLLAEIAAGNIKLDSAFINSDTAKVLDRTRLLTDYYTPTSRDYVPERVEEVNTIETDALHLAGLNTTLGQILGTLQSQVEDLRAYMKELRAKKELQVEQSLLSGLRVGKVSDRRVKAIVEQDSQVVEAGEMLSVARRRATILGIMCDRAESTINMLKIRARGLRRGA